MLFMTGNTASDQMLTLNASNSIFVGNIMVGSKSNGGKKYFGMAKMIFSGNGVYAVGNGDKLTTNTSLPANSGQYALVGAIINNNGGQADVEFKNGGKMFGDIGAYSASQAKNIFSFDGTYGSNDYALEGSISSTGGGTNTITFKQGNVYAHSIALGANYGLLAQKMELIQCILVMEANREVLKHSKLLL